MMLGSCSCKKIKVECIGQPQATALCHCTDCRKISGSAYTLNFIVKSSELNVTGSPKELPKVADTGSKYINYFCPDCGSPLYGGIVTASGEPDTLVVRAGIFDDHDVLSRSKPVIEIYVAQRLSWIAPVPDCAQYDGMPPSS